MEKLKPHYDLSSIQGLVATLGAAAFTKTAPDGGRAMGLTSDEMLAVVAGLGPGDCYKAMTTQADHTIWQDVYHASTPVGKEAYVKLTRRDQGPPVIQFKEK